MKPPQVEPQPAAAQCDDPASGLLRVLQHVYLLPRRLVLETQSREIEVPRLRGVWGAALHDLDRAAYERIFHPDGSQLAGYLLRPVIGSPAERPEFDFILLGEAADDDSVALRAWDVAAGMGIGKSRERFHIRARGVLGPNGQPADDDRVWPLASASWPLAGDPATTPCRLRSLTPLSLMRHGRLIETPTIQDIVAKGCRRLGAFIPPHAQPSWPGIKARLIDFSRQVPAGSWQGEPVAVKRYSASQHREFAVAGVQGQLDLPAGPGPLWPLLAALQWIHVGKSTNVGLGWLGVENL